MSVPDFDVVVAMDRARGIARHGAVPWRLPADLAHFRRLTTVAGAGLVNAVIMGRLTWESLPPRFRPLPGRRNIVVSRSPGLALPAGVHLAGSVADALCGAGEGIDRMFVIGGAAIYAQALALPACRALYITRVDIDAGCDLFFPPFEPGFERASVLDQGTDAGLGYSIEEWRRASGAGERDRGSR